jgi:hypothetical protein
LILTFSTSPTTIQIAIDSNLGTRIYSVLRVLAGSAKLLGSNTSLSVLSGDIATHGSPTKGSPGWLTVSEGFVGDLVLS